MKDTSNTESQILNVANFQDLVVTPFEGNVNAICWSRALKGDFHEIVKKIEITGNMAEVSPTELTELQLTDQGKLAREIILKDLSRLKAQGASPTLNLIKCYERDDVFPFFPTDVYSFHVDRSPVPTDTFLCTYYGESSDILPNSQAQQKVLIPEIRDALIKLHEGSDDDFESFLSEHFFDLHYEAEPNAQPISLGEGHLWKLAVDHPESKVSPCLHRAPMEKKGQNRLLLIC